MAKGDDDDDADGDEMAGGQAIVWVAHASPDAPAVDVLVDGDLVFGDVEYGMVMNNYASLDPGTYTVTITAADDRETVAFEGDVTFEETFYTDAAIDELSDDSFRPLVLPDDDMALVRLVHASPDAPAVDVGVEGADLTLFEEDAFGEATRYVAVPPGEYTVGVRSAGADGDPVATFDVAVESGRFYSGDAIGYLNPGEAAGDEPFDLLVARDGPEDEADDEDGDGGADDGGGDGKGENGDGGRSGGSDGNGGGDNGQDDH